MSFESDYCYHNVDLARRLIRRFGRKWAQQARMPDPEYTPTAFLRWYSARRDAAAARRGVFPRKGRGWVFVPAL